MAGQQPPRPSIHVSVEGLGAQRGLSTCRLLEREESDFAKVLSEPGMETESEFSSYRDALVCPTKKSVSSVRLTGMRISEGGGFPGGARLHRGLGALPGPHNKLRPCVTWVPPLSVRFTCV